MSTTHHILTIDDEEDIVNLIVNILESHHYQATGATKWTEAVEALGHKNPDLVLLDLNMPTIHGTSMLDFIRSEGFDVPVVVVSGYVHPSTAGALYDRGISGIIYKPFKSLHLLREIERVLGVSQEPADYTMRHAQHLRVSPLSALDVLPKADAPVPLVVPLSLDVLYDDHAVDASDSSDKKPPIFSNDTLGTLDLGDKVENQPDAVSPVSESVDEVLDHDPNLLENKPVVAEVSETTLVGSSAGDSHGLTMGTLPEAGTLRPLRTSRRSRPSHKSVVPRRRTPKREMMFFGGIAVVCILIASILAIAEHASSNFDTADIKKQAQDAISNQVKQEVLKELQTQSVPTRR